MATEKRLIYLDDAKEALTGWETDPTDEEIEYTLDCLPKVDAVPVVRCKDCKWRNTKGCPYMNFNASARDDFDFCSDGERGTNGQS